MAGLINLSYIFNIQNHVLRCIATNTTYVYLFFKTSINDVKVSFCGLFAATHNAVLT